MTVHSGAASAFDAVVVGGGFYGCVIASYLARQRGLARVLLVERHEALLTRASYRNQARIHGGYHYPRSFVTANRCRANMPRFVRDWPEAVHTDFPCLYAIARRNSRVTTSQFRRFCKEIHAPLEPVDVQHRHLFNSRLIEDVFLVHEPVFDTTTLAAWCANELRDCPVEVRLRTRAMRVARGERSGLCVTLRAADGDLEDVDTRLVINCGYSGLHQLHDDGGRTHTPLKHEITEMAVIQLPTSLSGLGITVMDGPFFSIMPFPPKRLHTLSHVRYTPHLHWIDEPGLDPYERLARYDKTSRFDRMARDVERYLPSIADASYVDSLFEVKTVLLKNESDDGRPILFEHSDRVPGYYSVLGGKIDNVYDVLERMQHADL